MGHGPMSPLRYQHHPVRNLPYRNSIRPSHFSGDGEAGLGGTATGTLGGSKSFVDISTAANSSNNNNKTATPAKHQAGGYGNPYKGGGESSSKPLLESRSIGRNEDVDTIVWYICVACWDML